MESVQPPAGSQVSRLPAQRPPSEQLAAPPSAPAPGAGAPVPPPRRRLRTILTVTAAVLAALVLGGIVGGYVLYARATTPDRSAPDVVVDNYLRAYLVDRNDIRADVYTCEGELDLDAIAALQAEILDREAKFDVDVRVSWGPLSRSTSPEGESVTTTLSISSSSNGVPRSGRFEEWTFDLVQDDSGWRVCGGQKAD